MCYQTDRQLYMSRPRLGHCLDTGDGPLCLEWARCKLHSAAVHSRPRIPLSCRLPGHLASKLKISILLLGLISSFLSEFVQKTDKKAATNRLARSDLRFAPRAVGVTGHIARCRSGIIGSMVRIAQQVGICVRGKVSESVGWIHPNMSPSHGPLSTVGTLKFFKNFCVVFISKIRIQKYASGSSGIPNLDCTWIQVQWDIRYQRLRL